MLKNNMKKNSMQTPYREFRIALNCLIEKNWQGKQEELARTAKISFPFLSQIKKGERVSSSKVQFNLAQVMGISYEDMLALGRELINQNDSEKIKDPEEDSEKIGEDNKPKPTVVHIDHMKIVEQFQDKKTAYDINRKLLEIEREAPELYKEIKNFIDYNHQKIDRKKTAVGD